MRLRDGKRECKSRWRGSGTVRESMTPGVGDRWLLLFASWTTGTVPDTRGNGCSCCSWRVTDVEIGEMTGVDDNGVDNDAVEECLCGMMRWSVGLLLLLLASTLIKVGIGEEEEEEDVEEVADEDIAAVGCGIVVQRRS